MASSPGRPQWPCIRQRALSNLPPASPYQEKNHCFPWQFPELLRTRRGRGQEQRRSEEHTSELQSLMRISYAVFCLKKKILPNKSLVATLRLYTTIHTHIYSQRNTTSPK